MSGGAAAAKPWVILLTDRRHLGAPIRLARQYGKTDAPKFGATEKRARDPLRIQEGGTRLVEQTPGRPPAPEPLRADVRGSFP